MNHAVIKTNSSWEDDNKNIIEDILAAKESIANDTGIKNCKHPHILRLGYELRCFSCGKFIEVRGLLNFFNILYTDIRNPMVILFHLSDNKMHPIKFWHWFNILKEEVHPNEQVR